jgi:ribosome-binding factor A
MGFVTITKIQLTADLRFARIYYSVLGDEDQKLVAEKALQENLRYIKKLIIERINMRYAMEIRFEIDKTLDHSQRIDEILKKIKDGK